VQGHRYNIFEHIGCLGETYEAHVATVVFHLPPIFIGAVSAVYCSVSPLFPSFSPSLLEHKLIHPPFLVLSSKSFYCSRAQFKELLSANKNLNLNCYVSLMALASTDLLLTVPLATFVLDSNVAIISLSPWISSADTHSNFLRGVQVPGIYWRVDPYSPASVETLRWATVVCALLFFAYFGFAWGFPLCGEEGGVYDGGLSIGDQFD
jgi:pheromone a factor receptor